MNKELDWLFWFKISASIIGSLFLFSFLVGSKWVFQKREEEDQQYQQKKKTSSKTNTRKPLRVQIMSLNTITLFFLLMCISEFRANEIASPMGVDPEKLPEKCKLQQRVFFSFFMSVCLVIVFYNFIIIPFLLKKAHRGNLITDRREKDSSRGIDDVVRSVNLLKSKNGMFMVENYPTVLEFVFFMLMAFLSILMYILLVLDNYQVLEIQLFRCCFHPLNNDRFFDPYWNFS